MNILIADDHSIVRQGIIALLKEEFTNFSAHHASDGGEVLVKIKDHVWDLILLDISMPVMNGLEVLKQIRSDGMNVPVLMLSMQPEDQYALLAIKNGASGFVNKANAITDLIPAVHIVLSGKKFISPALAKTLKL